MSDTDPDDVQLWRDKAEAYRRRLEEEREEFKDFQINSKELEAELETQLELTEKKNAELLSNLERMAIEMDTNYEKHESSSFKANRQISALQEELDALKGERTNQQQYIRQLEQENDDLERSNRAAVASLDDIGNRLNQVLEKNAILEVELVEKEELDVCVQRLKDEVRDLNQELHHRSLPTKNPEKTDSVCQETAVASVQTKEVVIVANNNNSSRMSTNGVTNLSVTQRPLTPSTRIAALKMVGDLLQKIAELEANFADVCRCCDVTPAKLAKLATGTTAVGVVVTKDACNTNSAL